MNFFNIFIRKTDLELFIAMYKKFWIELTPSINWDGNTEILLEQRMSDKFEWDFFLLHSI